MSWQELKPQWYLKTKENAAIILDFIYSIIN
jgi:hypothetical protein